MKGPVTLHVDGQPHSFLAEPHALLVPVRRDELGLTGTHIGCDTSHRGTCTILIDGKALESCTTLAVPAERSQLATISDFREAHTGASDAADRSKSFERANGTRCDAQAPRKAAAACMRRRATAGTSPPGGRWTRHTGGRLPNRTAGAHRLTRPRH